MPPKILTVPGYYRLVRAGVSMSWGWATAALRWMMQTKGIPAGQRKGSGCVKSQTYQGAATKYE